MTDTTTVGADLRVTAVTCVKNEGPFLIEWIAYHKMIGVTDFLFYSNDCDDGTDALLEALAERGEVVHLPNPAKGRNYQMEALKDAAKQKVVKKADWVWIADVDEFLNIHVGKRRIPDLINACGNPQAISVTFQFFANDGVLDYEDRPVIEQFTRTHNPDLWCGESAIEVKTLIRNDFPAQYFGAHRPFLKKSVGKGSWPVWTDGSGRQVQHRFLVAANPRRIRKFPAAGARDFATLNHYALRSLDSYLVKNDRGDVNRENRAFDDTYWRERNDGSWEERSIRVHTPHLQGAMRPFMTDPQILEVHQNCVRLHREKRDALMARPEYQDMYNALRDAPPYPPKEWELMKQLGLAA